MNTVDVERERRAFEAYLETKSARNPTRTLAGGYADMYFDILWEGWLAAKRDSAKGE